MKRTLHIFSLFLALFILPIGLLGARGQSADRGVAQQDKLIARKVIVPLHTSPHNIAKIALWNHNWQQELPPGDFKVYALKGSQSWRMELYEMVKDSCFTDKLSRAMGVIDIWNNIGGDSLPKIPSGHIALVDSFADRGTQIKLVDVRDFDSSPLFYDAVGGDISAFNTFCRSQLAEMDSSITLGHYFWGGRSSLADMMHSFQMHSSGCDLSLWAPAHWGDSLSGGYVYLHDIERLVPYSNTLVVATLSGEQLRIMMEQTYTRRFKIMKNNQSDLLRYRTPCYLHGQFSGIAHSVDVTKSRGLKVKLDRNQMYRVVMNSFMAREIETIETIGDYRLLLTKWIMGNSPKANHSPSLELHPHPWVKTSAARERTLLDQEYM